MTMMMKVDVPVMHWPGLRAKLFPITIIRIPVYWPWMKFAYGGCHYFGTWWRAEIGPWLIIGGNMVPISSDK